MKLELSDKIIREIKEKQLSPKPKRFFILRNTFFWFLSILSIIIGAVSFATLLYNFSGNQDILKELLSKNNFSLEIINFIPFYWIIILIIFLILSLANYKKTERFYKYSLNYMLLLVLTLSFGLGAIMFSFGIGEKTDKFGQKYLPFYDRYQKIMTIKKEIFKNKLKKIGVTAQILKDHPKLKEKIDKKFRENVLGKKYLYTKEECQIIKYNCPENYIKFSDEFGCGCRDLYLK